MGQRPRFGACNAPREHGECLFGQQVLQENSRGHRYRVSGKRIANYESLMQIRSQAATSKKEPLGSGSFFMR
jgi:hypothetical protein